MPKSAVKTIVIMTGFIVLAAIIIGIQLWPSGRGGGVKVGGPFTLVDQEGKTRTDVDFRGRFMLVYFGYTYCPDVCPTAVHQMGLALDELGKASDKVRPVFITIDPARDTPARLKDYAANFHPRLVALTGDAASIAKAAKAYRVYFARPKESGSDTDYLMDHTSIIYLMGPDGRYVTHFTHGTDVEKMAARMRDHLS